MKSNRDKGENEGKKGRTMEIVLVKEEEKKEREPAPRARKREAEKSRSLSPTRTRGSYESRGRRNPDYCSPDYNITRTDRSAYITGDQIHITSLFNIIKSLKLLLKLIITLLYKMY